MSTQCSAEALMQITESTHAEGRKGVQNRLLFFYFSIPSRILYFQRVLCSMCFLCRFMSRMTNWEEFSDYGTSLLISKTLHIKISKVSEVCAQHRQNSLRGNHMPSVTTTHDFQRERTDKPWLDDILPQKLNETGFLSQTCLSHNFYCLNTMAKINLGRKGLISSYSL